MDKDGVVVDSDVISSYYQQSIRESGEIFILINEILSSCGISISDKIEREWKKTTGNQTFNIWFEDQVKLGRIGYIDKPDINQAIRKKIHIKFGLPEQGKDIELIKTANKTPTIKYILTLDIHLFDPKIKMACAKIKYKVKCERRGKLCNFLYRYLRITVGLPKHCCNDLKHILFI